MNRVHYYSVAPAVARKAGTLSTTYRTKDGRFIMSEKQVNVILAQDGGSDISSLDIVEIAESDAGKLIQLGGYKMGDNE